MTPTGEAVEDGTHPAYLTAAEPARLTFDRIDLLPGEEAAAARAGDGERPAEEGVDLPYGAPTTPFELTVRDGQVTELVEVYLP